MAASKVEVPAGLWPFRSGPPEVTHGMFAHMARRRGWTVDSLSEQFAGRFGDQKDPPRRFFERILQERHYDDVVIPYDSVIEFYRHEASLEQLKQGTERRCACGCGTRVFGRRALASAACRKRASRDRSDAQSVTGQNGPKKPL